MIDSEQATFAEHDTFQRLGIGQKVIDLLVSDVAVSPMIIDGGWGTGKTVFCKQLIDLFELQQRDSHNCAYIDAFKADHSDEPLLTLIAALVPFLPADGKASFIKKILPAIRFGTKTVGKALVKHLLKEDTDSLTADYNAELQYLADKAIDASVASVLQSHVDAEKNLATLQTALMELVREKPLVLFIDELDRCRPDYAVAMLEVIKHVFNVNGVQFVLVTNTQQLQAAIHHAYGAGVVAHRYLNKFVQFSFTLPYSINASNLHDNTASVIQYELLIRQSELPDCLAENKELVLVQRIIQVNGISLREVETLVRYLQIYWLTAADNSLLAEEGREHNSHRLFMILGIALCCFRPQVATDITAGQADVQALVEFLDPGEIVNWDGTEIEIYTGLVACLGPECAINSAQYTPTESQVVELWNGYKLDLFGLQHNPNIRLMPKLRRVIMAINLFS